MEHEKTSLGKNNRMAFRFRGLWNSAYGLKFGIVEDTSAPELFLTITTTLNWTNVWALGIRVAFVAFERIKFKQQLKAF